MSRFERAAELYRDHGFAALLERTVNLSIQRAKSAVGRYLVSPFLALPPIDSLCFRLSVRRLRDRKREEVSIDEVLDTAFNFRGCGFYRSITPIQHPDELRELLLVIDDVNPDTIVEIGTDRGGTLYVWCRATEARTVVSCDINYNRIENSTISYHNRRCFYHNFTDEGNLYFVQGNSHQRNTFERITDVIPGSGVDFLFIDADHSYEGVRRDFELYAPIMADDGVIALHDIKHDRCGVPEFWTEIREEYDTREIYHDTSVGILPHIGPGRRRRIKHGCGIGLVFL